MPLITLTSYMGAGGRSIAQKVAKGLRLEFFDETKFQEEALKTGISPEDRAHLEERPPGIWGYIWRQKPAMYIDLMESVVYELAKRGDAVIIGHAGQILLSDFECALHVLVCAPKERRIQRLVEKQGMSQEGAEKLIRKVDQEQEGFFHFAFHRDLNDPSLYDLVINTAKTKEEAAAHLIMEAAITDTIKECSLQAMTSMEKLALVKKVEAAILKNDLFLIQVHVEVPSPGVVQISGYTHSQEDKDKLLRVVKQVRGVIDLRADVTVLRMDGM